MQLEGQLVNLVPYGKRFQQCDHTWWNGPGAFFWTRGDHWIMSNPQIEVVHVEIAGDQQLAEKLGFRLEGRRRSALVADGQPCDELIYGLLRDEWV